ncbi:hypothetical protein, partial [Micromonospora echinofusca]|nr:hypothetical protein [Micromonospora echinofusca]
MTTMRTAPAPALPPSAFAGSYLLAGVAALALVSAVGGFFAVPEFSYLKGRQAQDNGAAALAGVGLLGFAVLAVGFGVLCLLLAFLIARSSTGARVLAGIACGVSICFNIGLLAVGAFQSVPWYGELSRILAVGMLLLSAGSLVLLALPSSRGHFRAVRDAQLLRQP